MGPLVSAIPFVQIFTRTAVIYFVVLIGLRLTGKREIGQFTPFDLVLVLLIANAVQNAMVGPDTSLSGGIVAALTLLGINYLVSAIADRSRILQELTVGKPTLLIHDGKVIESNLTREKITYDELEAALREHGINKISDVQGAVLEVDGSISVVPKVLQVTQTKKRIKYIRRH
ncbi:MAG TPA: YetF domain-containing protein [Candidatus Aquicultor sp.]|jgi:uncharacterized membrane protein YcaP (DUF421 family)